MSVSLNQFIDVIEGTLLTEKTKTDDTLIKDGYVSDLLSDVMGSAKDNQVWITIMRHLNSVAVASLANIPCIVFAKGIKPEPNVIDKANEEQVVLVSSDLPSFEIAGKLYMLLHGSKNV